MRKTKYLITALCAALALTACGGKTEPAVTTAAQTKTSETAKTSETTKAAETEKETEPIVDTEQSAAAKKILSESEFIDFIDMILEESNVSEDASEFYIEFEGEKYFYDELSGLYDALAAAGGRGPVSIMGEEDELDFDMIAQMNDIMEDEDEFNPASFQKDQFIKYFDYIILEKEYDKDSFKVGLNGDEYDYDHLGDLYDVMKDMDGSAYVVMPGSEDEESLSFEYMYNYLDFYDGWYDDEEEEVDQALIDRFYGDWSGVVGYYNCSGAYRELENVTSDSLARFVIDHDGTTYGFLGIFFDDVLFENETAELSTDDKCLYISGTWDGMDFNHIPITEENGTLSTTMEFEGPDGTISMIFHLRHLNDPNWEGITPQLPEERRAECLNKPFEDLATEYGYSVIDYPTYGDNLEQPDYTVETEAEKEDFGKTTEDADGIVAKGTLQSGYDELMKEMDNVDHDPLTYERVRDMFGGTDGVKDMPYQWDEYTHAYEWLTTGEKDWVSIMFRVESDGTEILTTVNQSESILNGD